MKKNFKIKHMRGIVENGDECITSSGKLVYFAYELNRFNFFCNSKDIADSHKNPDEYCGHIAGAINYSRFTPLKFKTEPVKGKDLCNRKACLKKLDKDNTWWNETMQSNYCEECASKINWDPNYILCVRR